MTPAEARGHQASVHLAIEDSSGDSAIIEYISGKPVIHHGREFRIMANDPVYDEQLAAGLFEAEQRFADSRERQRRRAFPAGRLFKAMLPEPKNEREAVAGVLAIARNVSVPFGAPYEDFGIYNTEYRTVIDLTNKRYFFELTTRPNVIWVDLSDLKPGAPVMILNPDNMSLSGEVAGRFQKAARAPF